MISITRRILIRLVKEKGYKVVERDISISEFYNADAVFVCGTVGEVVPVSEIDGKKIRERVPQKYTKWLMYEYKKLTSELVTPIEWFGVSILYKNNFLGRTWIFKKFKSIRRDKVFHA